MSKYSLKGLSVMDVQTGEFICKGSSYEDVVDIHDQSIININTPLKTDTVIGLADKVCEFLQENPECMGDDNLTFKFRLPYIGGRYMQLEFSGANMDIEAYSVLKLLVALLLVEARKEVIQVQYSGKMRDGLLEAFSEMQNIIIESFQEEPRYTVEEKYSVVAEDNSLC